MKLTYAALGLIAVILPATAKADDAYWPGEPSGYTSWDGYHVAQPAASTCRADDPRPSCHILNDKFIIPAIAVDAAELKAQQAASKAHTAALLSRLTGRHGHPCRADIKPVWIAERCNEKAFGSPIGANSN
jgi:hypothetical protein